MKQEIPSFYCPTKIFMGINSHEKIHDLIGEWKLDKLFVVSDSVIVKTDIYACVENILKSKGVRFEVFTEVEPEPSAGTVHKAFDVYRQSNAPAILALGGGSTMDAAKGVAILATNGGRINDYEGNEKFSKAPVPVIAIPTTAGTGSEVSRSCVITDTERHVKMSIRHTDFNRAKVAILDPIALKTLPASVAVHAGIDAFVHAFESYIALAANPVTDSMNLYAMELMSHNIRQFVSNRNNLDAGLNMACGSTLAGITFAQTGLGNVHCMARVVGIHSHVSHGLANALCFPVVAEFNLLANPKKFARIALAMGENVQGLSENEAAKKACSAIKAMCKDLGIPEHLRDVGVTEAMLPQMAKVCAESGYNKWNPRFSTERDFSDLFHAAF